MKLALLAFLFLPVMGFAQLYQPTITVQGTATVQVPLTTAVFNAQLIATGKTPEEAKLALSAKTKPVEASINGNEGKGKLKGATKVVTNLQISQTYSNQGNPDGYSATYNFSFQAPKDLTTEFLNTLTSFNPDRSSPISYIATEKDLELGYLAALEKATLNGYQRASTVLTALQKDSTVKIAISTIYQAKVVGTSNPGPQPMYAMKAARLSGDSLEISTEESTALEVSIDLTYNVIRTVLK